MKMTLASKIDFLHIFWGSLPPILVTWANPDYSALAQRKTAWKAEVRIITEQIDFKFLALKTLLKKID